MNITRPREAMKWLAIGIAGFTNGCTASTDLSRADEPIEDGAEVSSAALERRLVDREYPYSLGEDAVGCGDWEIVAPSGEVVDVKREWYPMVTMNRHLANVGTPEAVAHVDAELRDALRAKGIERIDTCDQAREYVRLSHDRLTARAGLERLEHPAIDEADYDFDAEPSDDFEDKILNGSSFDHPSTVGIQTLAGYCTGNLIGPFAMLTAAHCVPSTGFIALRAWIQPAGGSQTCISQPGGGTCAPLGPATVYAQRHPSYDGNEPFDQAVVIINPGWYAPANTSARWTHFAANWGLPLVAGLNLEPIRIDGYGVNALTGGGGVGVGRRGNSTHKIQSVNPAGTVFTIQRDTASSSAICGGDSGSGPYNTTMLSGGASLMMGITSTVWAVVGTDCTAVGNTSQHSIPDSNWVKNLVQFFGGTCTILTHAASGTPYMRCW
jgi:hypothetical protein